MYFFYKQRQRRCSLASRKMAVEVLSSPGLAVLDTKNWRERITKTDNRSMVMNTAAAAVDVAMTVTVTLKSEYHCLSVCWLAALLRCWLMCSYKTVSLGSTNLKDALYVI